LIDFCLGAAYTETMMVPAAQALRLNGRTWSARLHIIGPHWWSVPKAGACGRADTAGNRILRHIRR